MSLPSRGKISDPSLSRGKKYMALSLQKGKKVRSKLSGGGTHVHYAVEHERLHRQDLFPGSLLRWSWVCGQGPVLRTAPFVSGPRPAPVAAVATPLKSALVAVAKVPPGSLWLRQALWRVAAGWSPPTIRTSVRHCAELLFITMCRGWQDDNGFVVAVD